MANVKQSTPVLLPESLHPGLENLEIISKIRTDSVAKSQVATDFGNISVSYPAAVFYPSSPEDIATLINFSYTCSKPFTISQRGAGHSVYGQTFAPDGIVIDMPSLGRGGVGNRITVVDGPIPYADVGGEQFWIDVFNATLKYGLMPRTHTDYMYLTVAGALSNAGISGRTFLHGPLISNVYELDVITGTGEMVTCSRDREPELFYAALGGLGQFGVITRARIALQQAQEMVTRFQLFYTDVKLLMSDQEKLILGTSPSLDFVEGQVIPNEKVISTSVKSPFISDSDLERITSLAANNNGPIYILDIAAYYNEATATSVAENLKLLLDGLQYVPGFAFSHNTTLVDFLTRVRPLEVPHPWLDLFVPKSKILDFDSRVFKDLLKDSTFGGYILVYPMIRSKWDDKMSAVIPTEEVFYIVDLLWSALSNDAKILENVNNQILSICESNKLESVKYLSHYTNQSDWRKHYGNNWGKFVSRKKMYDPKALLSPGQQIFTPLHSV